VSERERDERRGCVEIALKRRRKRREGRESLGERKEQNWERREDRIKEKEYDLLAVFAGGSRSW
jgi:hypothetical protein